MKARKLITIAAGAALLLAGCAKEDGGTDGWKADTPITIAAVTVEGASPHAGTEARYANTGPRNATRAGLTTNSTFNAGLFGSGGASFLNLKYTANGNGGMTPADGSTVYWQNTNPLTVIAYVPYNTAWDGAGIGAYDFSVVADQSTAEAVERNDLLWAQTSDVSFGTGVNLTFAHKLSKLKITLEPDGTSITQAEWEAVSSLSVKVVNTCINAAFTPINGSLRPNTDLKGSITPYKNNDGSYEAIIVPQGIAAGTALLEISFTYMSNTFSFVYPVPAGGQAFDTGKEYTYPVTVSRSGITVGAPSIGEWGGNTDNPITGDTKIRYKAGDYYPDPDAVYSSDALVSGTAAKGVVFWLDPDAEGYNAATKSGVHGLIVSLDEGTNLRWDDGNYDTGALNYTDGLSNMAVIADYIDTQTKQWSNFPAFAWCDFKNGAAGSTTYASGATGVWYFPSLAELQYLLCAAAGKEPETWRFPGSGSLNSIFPSFSSSSNQLDLSAFSTTLEAAGGTALDESLSSLYWSSTEENYRSGYTTLFKNGSTNVGIMKVNPLLVRAVMAF